MKLFISLFSSLFFSFEQMQITLNTFQISIFIYKRDRIHLEKSAKIFFSYFFSCDVKCVLDVLGSLAKEKLQQLNEFPNYHLLSM